MYGYTLRLGSTRFISLIFLVASLSMCSLPTPAADAVSDAIFDVAAWSLRIYCWMFHFSIGLVMLVVEERKAYFSMNRNERDRPDFAAMTSHSLFIYCEIRITAIPPNAAG